VTRSCSGRPCGGAALPFGLRTSVTRCKIWPGENVFPVFIASPANIHSPVIYIHCLETLSMECPLRGRSMQVSHQVFSTGHTIFLWLLFYHLSKMPNNAPMNTCQTAGCKTDAPAAPAPEACSVLCTFHSLCPWNGLLGLRRENRAVHTPQRSPRESSRFISPGKMAKLWPRVAHQLAAADRRREGPCTQAHS